MTPIPFHPAKTSPGFTLLEVLVVSLIVLVLAGATMSGYQSLRDQSMMTTEMGAGRALIQGYLGYAADHSGRLMPGYQADPEATNDRGEKLHYPVNARYPWRLAPNLPGLEGTLLLHGNENLLDAPNRDYLVSVRPSLGLNAVFVGGHFGSGSPLRPDARTIDTLGKFHVTHLAEAHDPSRLLVFCSARGDTSGPGAGNFEVRPPRLLGPVWSDAEFDPSAPPDAHGMVDFRWSGKAVAVFLGGNAMAMDEQQLRDMRLWSNLANVADDPGHLLRRR